MRSGRVLALAALLLIGLGLALVCVVPMQAATVTPYVLARFTPESGSITDAAMLEGRVVLLYPDSGRIAEYDLEGRLKRHIVREAGIEKPFKPVWCVSHKSGAMLVFDEAEHKLFTIITDGNFSKGIDLAYPTGRDGSAVALSRISGLTYGAGPEIRALLAEQQALASFNDEGKFVGQIAFADSLPYDNAVYTRPQMLPDGSLFVLEYHQGAVLYRAGKTGEFRRVRTGKAEGVDALPLLQDFAVDESRNIIAVTAGDEPRVLLLSSGEGGYKSRSVDVKLPDGAKRVACRYSQGKFILWLREAPFATVLELR